MMLTVIQSILEYLAIYRNCRSYSYNLVRKALPCADSCKFSIRVVDSVTSYLVNEHDD